MDDYIPGGYVMIARAIKESDIAHASPVVRDVWYYLIQEANHKDTPVCKRGQTVRRYDDIREALHWMQGWRKRTYSKWQCEEALKKLRTLRMITTKKTTRGLVITLCNYDRYQTAANYEHHTEPDIEPHSTPQTSDIINKNGNNEKKKKGRFAPPTSQQVIDYARTIDYLIDGSQFVDFYASKGWKVGSSPMKDWQAAVRTWKKRDSKPKPAPATAIGTVWPAQEG